jgi:hypothetical protein
VIIEVQSIKNINTLYTAYQKMHKDTKQVSPIKHVSDPSAAKAVTHLVYDLGQQLEQQVRELVVHANDYATELLAIDNFIQILAYLLIIKTYFVSINSI